MLWTTGEALIDVIIQAGGKCSFSPGGAMLNTAVNLGRMGDSVGFVGICGEDAAGKHLAKVLGESGIDTSGLIAVRDFRTPLALAFLDGQRNADYTFYRDQFPADKMTFPRAGKGDLLLAGSYQALLDGVHQPLLDWITESRRRGALFIYDPNFRRPHLQELERFRPRIQCLMKQAEIVKASDEDLQLIFGIADGRSAWEFMREMGPKVLVYTMGAKGATWFDHKDEIFLPAPEVEVVSTIGAGDAFNAGLMSGIGALDDYPSFLNNTQLKWQILRNAIGIASEVCSLEGNHIERLP